jgi:hypothetical protein
MQKPSTFWEYRMSIASMIIAESDEFLPAVYLYCCMGVIAYSSSTFFHP